MQNISLTEKSDRHGRLTKNCSKQTCRLRKEFLIHASPRNNKRIQTIKSKTKTKTKSIISKSILSKTKTKKKSIIKKTRREREGGGASTQIRGVPGHVPRCQGPVLLPSPSLPLFSLPASPFRANEWN